MIYKALILALATFSGPLIAAAADNVSLQHEIRHLQQKTRALQVQLIAMQKQLASKSARHDGAVKSLPEKAFSKKPDRKPREEKTTGNYQTRLVSAHTPDGHPGPERYYPTALLADDRVIAYIAGTPVVTSPYTGERPAFDGSDFIVNISSINRDIRLMEQRRRVYDAYRNLGYGIPKVPIIALSGKLEPAAFLSSPYFGNSEGDITLGSSELDVAVGLNQYVEAFMSIAFDNSPPALSGQRVSNSSFDLNLGFVNIGNLDQSPFYFTAGQLFAPFGRYSTAMISSPVTMVLARTKTRPFIFGYKSQSGAGPYAAGYTFISDTTLGHSGVGGVNAGYTIRAGEIIGDMGAGLIGSIADSGGMQRTGGGNGTFAGFAAPIHGSESIGKIPGVNLHGNLSFDRYSLTAEWVGASRPFNPLDLSFNGHGAQPQAAQFEAGVTFMAFNRPASLAVGYQWSEDTLALNLPEHRINSVFNISIWKDTVESIEYRHDIDFSASSFANGAAAPGEVNVNTVGTGKSFDTVVVQIGVYF